MSCISFTDCMTYTEFHMMTSSNGNIFRVTGPLCGEFSGPGEFPTQRPVTRSFVVFFDLCLNKRLSKQSWGWWFQTLSGPLWRHGNDLLFHVERWPHVKPWIGPVHVVIIVIEWVVGVEVVSVIISAWKKSCYMIWRHNMERFSHRWLFVRILSITDGFPSLRANDAELWHYICSKPEQAVEQRGELSIIWDASTLMWRHCNVFYGHKVDSWWSTRRALVYNWSICERKSPARWRHGTGSQWCQASSYEPVHLAKRNCRLEKFSVFLLKI